MTLLTGIRPLTSSSRGSLVVVSITRADDNPTIAASVDFIITFSKSVTGVDVTDFTLTATGILGATISGVNGSGSSYTVTVNTGSGNGIIRLNLIDDNSILDLAGNPLGGPDAGDGNFTDGETYTIEKIALASPSGSLVSWDESFAWTGIE